MRVCTGKQRRNPTLVPGAMLGLAAGIAVTFYGGPVPGARRAAGQSAGAPATDGTDSPGPMPDMPSGVFEDSDLPRLPVLPMRQAPPHVKATVRAMRRAYDHLVPPQTPAPGGIVAAPDSAQAPPRMDAGDSDPDRVQAPNPAPRPR